MSDARILLAHSPQGSIFACRCGAIHVVAGKITRSFSLEEFVVMLELHRQAISGLEANIHAVREMCYAGHAQQNASRTAIN